MSKWVLVVKILIKNMVDWNMEWVYSKICRLTLRTNLIVVYK